jgi:hypothetical protein
MKILSWLFKNKPPYNVGDKVCLDKWKVLDFPEFVKWYGFSNHVVNKIKRGPLKAGGWLVYLDRDNICGLYSNYFKFSCRKDTLSEEKRGEGSYFDKRLFRFIVPRSMDGCDEEISDLIKPLNKK